MSEKGSEDQVREWLRTQGYPLEYEAARVLRSGGFRTVQGWSYRVEDAGQVKAREIDVLASWDGTESMRTDSRDLPVFASFSAAVECKHVTAPWVVLTTAHPPPWRPIVSQWMGQLLRAAGVPGPEWFQLGPATGFSVKTADSRGKDVAHEALMQATNAAYAATVGASARASIERPTWTLPVVLVRGPLFTLGYDDEGNEALKATGWNRLVWHGADSVDEPTVVDVVTRDYWAEYVGQLASLARIIVGRLDDHRAKEKAADLLGLKQVRSTPEANPTGDDRR